MADSIEVTLIDEKIASAASAGIQSATSDGVTVTSMTIDELVKASNYLAAKNATTKNSFGLRFIKMIPPGLP